MWGGANLWFRDTVLSHTSYMFITSGISVMLVYEPNTIHEERIGNIFRELYTYVRTCTCRCMYMQVHMHETLPQSYMYILYMYIVHTLLWMCILV